MEREKERKRKNIIGNEDKLKISIETDLEIFIKIN
jgi:hypothetical protein